MKILILGVVLFTSLSCLAAIYERFDVLDRKGNCVYVRYYWTGGFSERYFKGWTCAKRPSSKELANTLIQQAREYLNNPKNRSEIIDARLSEIIKYKSDNTVNRWQKACADKYYTLYSNNIIDYKSSFDWEACWGIDNKYSFTCFNDLIEYKYSGIHDQYKHDRLNALQACRYVNSELKLNYVDQFKKLIEEYNDNHNKLELLDQYMLENSKFISNKDNIKCVIGVNQHNGLISSFLAEECQYINTNREKSCLSNKLLNSGKRVTATDVLLCSD